MELCVLENTTEGKDNSYHIVSGCKLFTDNLNLVYLTKVLFAWFLHSKFTLSFYLSILYSLELSLLSTAHTPQEEFGIPLQRGFVSWLQIILFIQSTLLWTHRYWFYTLAYNLMLIFVAQIVSPFAIGSILIGSYIFSQALILLLLKTIKNN